MLRFLSKLYVQMIVMPYRLAPMKPDFIVLQFKPGFQMRLYKYFPNYFFGSKKIDQRFCSYTIKNEIEFIPLWDKIS